MWTLSHLSQQQECVCPSAQFWKHGLLKFTVTTVHLFLESLESHLHVAWDHAVCWKDLLLEALSSIQAAVDALLPSYAVPSIRVTLDQSESGLTHNSQKPSRCHIGSFIQNWSKWHKYSSVLSCLFERCKICRNIKESSNQPILHFDEPPKTFYNLMKH